jgi:hypothetical protein
MRAASCNMLEWPLKVLGFAPSRICAVTHQAEPDLEAGVPATPDGVEEASQMLPAHRRATLQEPIKDIVVLPCAQPATLAGSLQPWEPTAGRRASKAPPARVPPSLA